MVTVNRSLTAQAPGDLRWLRARIPAPLPPAAAPPRRWRRGSDSLPSRADELALAVTEAATNLHKHARQGSMLLRITRDRDRPGIELVTIDAGPGLRDSGAALRDGHSPTSGTLGIGLGAINRLADFCDLYSVPGHGTALVARLSARAPLDYAVRRRLVRPITARPTAATSSARRRNRNRRDRRAL